MKLMLTLAFEGDREAFLSALRQQATTLADECGATRVALDVAVGPEDLAIVHAFATEKRSQAVVSLWDPTSTDAALKWTPPPMANLVGAYLTEEIVRRPYEKTWPDGDASPGVKLVCFVKRKAELDHAAYSRHWRDNHGPLALKHQTGIWHYVQNHIVELLTDSTPDFDGLGELHFKTATDVVERMFDGEASVTAIFEDVPRFMDSDASTTLPTKEYLIS
jgi:uncharacterized protein (TIGR02118 family)